MGIQSFVAPVKGYCCVSQFENKAVRCVDYRLTRAKHDYRLAILGGDPLP
ncbi:MAG: hypothetical protein JW388_1143 [Nitrospira sp.]|nr:hypothetical protein [Nitrospira sp.]